MKDAELDRFVWRTKAEARRDMGLCPDCGAERGTRSRCAVHLAVHAERARKARRAPK